MRHQRDEFSLKDSVDFLEKSGLAKYILRAKVSKGYCSIEYRKIPADANRTKLRNTGHHENPGFYRFVQGHLSAVIALVEDHSSSGIRLTSKSVQLTDVAHSKFTKGWNIAQQMLNRNYDGSAGSEHTTEAV
jgi:hypothetical protein